MGYVFILRPNRDSAFRNTTKLTSNAQTSNVKHSYLCHDDQRLFDYGFFGIHQREAESMDAQQKLLMELVYECVEAAGYDMERLRGSSTGVFIGQMTDDHRDNVYRDADKIPQYAATGTSRAILANRISYFFDWRGPSMNIDTACSSSLVALHQAVQSLRNGESQVAIVGGVNLISGPEPYIAESKVSSSTFLLSTSHSCPISQCDLLIRLEMAVVVWLKICLQGHAD